jgi:quercetin dioxygenase-like cupin family protein
MTFIKLIVCLVWLAPGLLIAQETTLTEVLSKDLSDLPAKECLMITVEYPPGASDPIHRHNAHGFIYVLEGSIVMQVKGGKEVTLIAGQASTKALMTFTSSGATRARPRPPNS